MALASALGSDLGSKLVPSIAGFRVFRRPTGAPRTGNMRLPGVEGCSECRACERYTGEQGCGVADLDDVASDGVIGSEI